MIISRVDNLHKSEISVEFEMTPMIDILFMLLLFFMLSVGVALQTVDVSLPTSHDSTTSLAPDKGKIILTIGHDNYLVNGNIVSSIQEFRSAIKQISQETHSNVLIASDHTVEMGKIIQVIAYLQSLQIQNVDIILRHTSDVKQ